MGSSPSRPVRHSKPMVLSTARSLGLDVNWDTDMALIGKAQIWEAYRATHAEARERHVFLGAAMSEYRDFLLVQVRNGWIGSRAGEEIGYVSLWADRGPVYAPGYGPQYILGKPVMKEPYSQSAVERHYPQM